MRRDLHDRKSALDTYRLTADAQGNTLQKWVLTNGEERRKLASSSAEDGHARANGAEVALAEIFEFRIPFELIGAQKGSRIRLRFSIWREHLPVDSMPLEGWIDLFALAGDELESSLYSVPLHE